MSGAQARGVYSALTRAVTSALDAPKRATAGIWAQWLDGAQRRGAVKQGERDWVGVDAWLEAQGGPVTREDLAAFVQAHEVRVQEVVLFDGAPALDWEAWSDRDEHGDRYTDAASGERLVEDAAGEFTVYDRDGEIVRDGVVGVERARQLAAAAAAQITPGGVPKYSAYRTPGGDNYRELLLTLPNAMQSSAMERRKKVFDDYRERIEDAHRRANTFGDRAEREAAYQEYSNLSDQRDRAAAAVGAGALDGYKSSHWDQPNVLAHVRFDERIDADGKRLLYIQEIQSDWHQEGRKRGYRGLTAAEEARKASLDAKPVGEWASEEMDWYNARVNDAQRDGVPNAPLKATDEWAMLAFKRMARWAVDNGFERIGWVTGEQAAELFNLDKHVESIQYRKAGADAYEMAVIAKGGGSVETLPRPSNGKTYTGVEVGEIVGKEMASKMAAEEGRSIASGPWRKLQGADLKIEAKGMRGFYDEILPSAVAKWAKKFGATVGSATIESRVRQQGDLGTANVDAVREFHDVSERFWSGLGRQQQNDLIRQFLADGGSQVLQEVRAIDITPTMREAMAQGMPLFRREDDQGDAATFRERGASDAGAVPEKGVDQTTTAEFKRWFGDSHVVGADGAPLVVYHGTGRDIEQFAVGADAAGQTNGNRTGAWGTYFTPSAKEASIYAEMAGAESAQNVMPVFLAITNPYVMSRAEWGRHSVRTAKAESSDAGRAEARRVRDEIEAAGHDGIVIRDRGFNDEWIAFRPEQIKSAVGNGGRFDPAAPSILHRRERSAAGAAGLAVEEVESIVREFVDTFRGNIGLAVDVAATQQEAFGEQATPRRLGTVKATLSGSRLVLVAGNHRDRADVLASLRHEVLGHYGLRVLADEDRRRVLERIVEARGSKGLGALWERVERHYRKLPGDARVRTVEEKAEEVFCHAAEHARPTTLGRAWTKVLAATARGLRAVRLIDDAITLPEIQDLAHSIARGIRRGSRRPEHAQESVAMSRRAGGFVSALTASIETARGAPREARAEQWRQWLDGAQRRGEFRRAEREWLGLDTWLGDHPGVVSREAIAEFVREQAVQVHEVVLGTRDRRQQMDEREAAYEAYRAGAITRVEWEDRLRRIDGDARFSQYQLPGGEHYRELLITLPTDAPPKVGLKEFERQYAAEREWNDPLSPAQETAVAQAWRAYDDGRNKLVFRTSHWPDHDNVLLHVRFNERLTLDGRRTVHIEELQSDWHQQGRRRGYGPQNGWLVLDEKGALIARQAAREGAEAIADAWRAGTTPLQREKGVPGGHATVEPAEGDVVGVIDAPFKRTEEWALLGIKRMVQWAVENGMDQISWTTGQMQVERYDMRHHVREIAVFKHPEGDLYDVSVRDLNGRRHDTATRVSGQGLEGHIGKELAEKARVQASRSWATYDGVDLAVGGEGMVAFYDRIVTGAVDRWAKAFGGEVLRATLESSERKFGVIGDPAQVWDLENDIVLPQTYDTFEAAERAAIALEPGNVHALRITPAMREAALDGLPLFRRESDPQWESPDFKAWFDGSLVVDEDGRPRVVYHGTPVRELGNGRSLGDVEAFNRNAIVDLLGRRARLDTVGSWFSTRPDEKGAGMYSGSGEGSVIYPVYLAIRNAYTTTFATMVRRAHMLAGTWDAGGYDASGRRTRKAGNFTVTVNASADIGQEQVDALRAWLKGTGRDGIRIVRDPAQPGGEFEHQDAWIALEPEQVKSAIGNNGRFDPAVPDIRFRRTTGEEVPAAISVRVDTGSAAFEDAGLQVELARVLNEAAGAIEKGEAMPFALVDINGERVGMVGRGIDAFGSVHVEIEEVSPAQNAERLRAIAELVVVERPAAAELQEGERAVASMQWLRERRIDEPVPGGLYEPA